MMASAPIGSMNDWHGAFEKLTVVIGTSEATAIALGRDDLEVLPLHDVKEVRYLGFQHANDAWTSTNGATFLGVWRDDPLLCHRGGAWSIVDLGLPPTRGHSRIVRVVGFSGPERADDETSQRVPGNASIGPQRRRHSFVTRTSSGGMALA